MSNPFEDKEFDELVRQDKLKKERVKNAKACAAIAAMPIFCAVSINRFVDVNDGHGGGYVLAAACLCIGFMFVVANLAGWND